MKNLFVVSHPESVHHVEHLVGGWYDTALTANGRAAAKLLADRLSSLVGAPQTEIYSSDLLRCSQTADIVAERLAGPVVRTSDLREISYGVAEGKPQAWLDAHQTVAPDDNRLDHRGGIENAETRREFANRIYRATEMIVGRPCSTQIIVTHGLALTFVVAAWIKMPIDAAGYVNFASKPGSITHLQQDHFWKSRTVRTLGDVRHLADGGNGIGRAD
ncbi:histidine phosphatase family protein [Bradyrhizobium sp. AUGA SZCCT0177]|uniref:histidine phosphatase family protein n=1 Tax=Bradyrhizobium sp. AUGA SZCCT0177 TaxID=2807665 RepID=UPI001BA881CB|nr:histidine phosphatase family protein [Bradyrhizobium sp. AUGA SZCCT0177]MBR1282104.1 histidine phosphatase family protein [Bradyrhizobium sp. AUGA SZCCT0177]